MGDAGQTTALAAWDTEREAWGERLPGEPQALWEWCAAQERDTLLELLAFLGAASLNAVKQRHERADCDRLVHADRLAAATGLDMQAHWTADAAFFRRLTKRAMLAALEEAQGSEAVRNCTGLPKDKLAEACTARLGSGPWLPLPLQIPDAARQA